MPRISEITGGRGRLKSSVRLAYFGKGKVSVLVSNSDGTNRQGTTVALDELIEAISEIAKESVVNAAQQFIGDH